ncbi:FHA domain-containing protein [Flavobacteriaceae bacterium]|nr:FHA domain-containing protein [Flavobacteriaceae bacterium]
MQQIKIGKAPTNDIVINDKTVSREHLVVFIDDDKNVFITDLGSTNGTYVNGVRIEESVKLETLDVLRVGNSLVEWPQFLISNNNLDKVYETLKDPDPIFKEKPVLKSEATNLKLIYKYSLIFVIIIVVVIIIMSFADRNTNYNDEVVIAERTNTEIPIKRKQQKKQRTSVTYDFSCLSSNGDIGSNDAIYNFGEITREVQSSFFDTIDISVDDEQDAGRQILEAYKKEYRFIESGAEFQNLKSISRNLVSRLAKPRGFNYKIYFIDDPMLNAMTAGGYIFFFKGMYDFCNTNSEIAAIISHEIAHNELGHLTLDMKKQKAASEWGILGEIVLGIENATTQSFNQKQESEADLFGMDLVYPTSFRNCDAITLWKRMSQNENEFDILDNFFRSHPYSKNRSNCIRNHLTSNYNKNCN